MIRILLLLILFPLFAQAVTIKSLSLWDDYPAGLNTADDSTKIGDTEFQDCSDVLFDEEVGVKVRGGIDRVSTTHLSSGTFKLMHEFTKSDGNKYMVVVTSNVLAYTTNASTFTVLLTTVTTTHNAWAVDFNGVCYLGFDKGDRYSFDGTLLTPATGIPQISHAIIYTNRIVGANVNESQGTSKVVYSDINNPTFFNALAFVHVDKDDGDEITGLFLQKGNLYVSKDSSLHQMLYLDDTDRTNDGYLPINDDVGFIYNSTIMTRENVKLGLSKRGLEVFDGSNVSETPVSDKISNLISDFSQSKADELYWVQSNASDFALGTETRMDTYTVSGEMRLKWHTASSTYTVTIASTAVTSYNFSQSYGQSFQLTTEDTQIRSIKVYATEVLAVNNIYCHLYSDNNNVPSQYLVGTDTVSIEGAGYITLTFNNPYTTPKNTRFWLIFGEATTYRPSQLQVDSGNPYASGNVIYGSECGDPISGIPYTWCATAGYEYAHDLLVLLNFSTFSATGFHKSQTFNAGTNWKQWGDFQATDADNTGEINYFVKIGSDAGGVAMSAEYAVTPGQYITYSTGPYIQVISSFSTPAPGSRTPILYDYTVKWFESLRRDNSVAIIHDLRYWIAGSQYPSTTNNVVYVLDSNLRWTKFDLDVSYMTYFRNELYLGGTDGRVYKYSKDYTDDDGTAIVPYIKTKDFDFGNPYADKYQQKLEVRTIPTTVYSDMTVNSYVNKYSTPSSTMTVSLTADTFFTSMPIIKADKRKLERWNTISFKITNFLRLLNLRYDFGFHAEE